MTKPFTIPDSPAAAPKRSKEEVRERRRLEKNAEALALGVYACPVCGDSMLVPRKEFHETEYYAGWLQGASVLLADGTATAPAVFRGALSITALCEECWEGLAPEQRLPHYERRFAAWRAAVPAVVTRPKAGGGIEDDPDDVERHRRDHAELDDRWAAIRDAVLAGG